MTLLSTHTKAENILEEIFGYHCFRGQQADIIKHLSEGGDALVLMPTGGGKSLCYQIPALLRSGVGIVVSPLIALMQDQVDALRQLGIRAAFLNSSLTPLEAREVAEQMRANSLDLLYVAPERLMTSSFLEFLANTQVALFAIDEAHCVSQWGHDFRPEYRQLSVLHEHFPHVPRIALTATADGPTRKEIVERLNLHEAGIFVSGFDRPNIHYRIVEKNNGRKQLLAFLESEHRGDAGIVYCLTRKKVESTADWLQTMGWNALPYHAGLPANIRSLHQQRFLREEGVVIVATIAFGMGIDKPNVRFVAHLDLPKSLEAYYQETGRAGRDGEKANAWLAYGLEDVVTLQKILKSSEADSTHKRVEQHKLDALLGFCEMTTCRRQRLLDYFGDKLEQACGNCDTCLQPPQTWDATEAAQKALSCVYRTGQRYGVAYIIDVLRGKLNDRIIRAGHDQLTTFGLGKELSAEQWRGIFRQLVAHGLLHVDIEAYGGLYLTEKARPVLRGEQVLQLRRDTKPEKTKGKAKSAGVSPAEADELFELLRAKRRELAEEQNVPPFVIFHDSTLHDMAQHLPVTQTALGKISGVGSRKLERYGEQFLEIIQSYIGRHRTARLSETVQATLESLQAGQTPEQIAAQRELKISTVYGHLADAIAAKVLSLEALGGIDEETKLTIEETFHRFENEEDRGRLKPLYDALEGKYDYNILRCVLASLPESVR